MSSKNLTTPIFPRWKKRRRPVIDARLGFLVGLLLGIGMGLFAAWFFGR